VTSEKLSRRDVLQWGSGLALAELTGLRWPVPPRSNLGPEGFSLQLIRNATLKLRIGQRTLLVDPYLAGQHAGRSYAGILRSPLVPLPLRLEEILEGVDAVFVSHLHSDHFDEVAQSVLPKTMPILCPEAIAPSIRAAGFHSVVGITDRLAWLGLTLHLTAGKHGPAAVLPDMGTVHGFVLTGPGLATLYWVGDSIWCPEVRAVVDHFAPATTVVHACGATWKGLGPLVMDEAQVEALLNHHPSGRVVATHLDCVDHATVSRASLIRHMSTFPALMPRLLVPADGERLQLPAKA
jgi:L-ascorbate metabolism protein UlaG (beta-lactamase superfamily)